MKFKKFFAALLGALMITSVMSFTANVGAEDTGIIKESTYHQKYGAERGQTSVQMYDAENDIIFSRMTPSTDTANSAKSCYINISGQNVAPTAEQIANDSVYVVFYVRTNMTMEADNKPQLDLYNCYWGPDSISNNGKNSLVTGNDNFIEQVGNDWGKMCFKLNTKMTISGTEYSINRWTQFAYLALGTAATKPISEWFTSVDEGVTPHVDCAGYAVVTSLEAAESYDFLESAKSPKVTLTFDAQTADDDSDITTTEVATGKWNTANVQFPEVTHPDDNYVFAGWYNGGTKIEDASAVAVPQVNTTYTAQWSKKDPQLSSLTINGTTPDKFSVTDINADAITIKLPYGWEKLESLGVMPTVVPVADTLSTAVYTAPADLSEEGKITITSGEFTKKVPVTFTIGTASAKTKMPAAGVYSTSGAITLPDGSNANANGKIRGVGLYSEKTTLNGIQAYKHTPIYKGSTLDGTRSNSAQTDPTKYEYYTSNRSVNLEGYNAYGTYDYESYEVYRALAYIDTGANGKFDVTPMPWFYFQGSSTTGTVKTNGTGNSNGFGSLNNYIGDRWEYIYFVKNEKTEKLYGKALQPVFGIFGVKCGTLASAYTDDVFYCAEITALPDAPDFVQYHPTGLTATRIGKDTPGTVSGLSDDMEMLVGEAWTAITSVDGYADGVLTVDTPATYSFRYAATDVLGASEAVNVEVLSGSVFVTFDMQDGNEAIAVEYDLDTDVTVPASPARTGFIFKGWSETRDGEIIDLTGFKATETKTYYAIWEAITKVYLDGTAGEEGNGLSAQAPFKTFRSAWNTVKVNGGTIVIKGDILLYSEFNNPFTNGNGDIVITNKDGDTTYDGKLILGYPGYFKTDESTTGKLTFEYLNIVQEHSYGGQDKNIYRYTNFGGLEVEFGEGINIVSTADEDGYTPLRMRIGGELGANHFGRKTVIRSGSWGSLVLGGKNGVDKPYSLDVEYYGGDGTLTLGNDSNIVNKDTDRDGVKESYYTYGRIKDVKLLFEAAPTSMSLSHINGIDGSFQVIANNGIKLKMPLFTYTNNSDTTTNDDGKAFTADLTPKGGYWRINSAEGGRADFTETTGTFRFTTDATYVIITNNKTDEYERYRVSDGVYGDASFFSEDSTDSLDIALEPGEYSVTYTDEGVKVNVIFDNGDADETYTLVRNESATYTGTVTVPVGYLFNGWKSTDGSITIPGNTYTASEFVAREIVFVPNFKRDTSEYYYFTNGSYNKYTGEYDVTVCIANDVFTLGTVGVQFDNTSLTYKGYTLGDGVSDEMSDTAEIVKDSANDNAIVIVWNAIDDPIDGVSKDGVIVTFHFDVKNKSAFLEKFGTDVPASALFTPAKDYTNYFENGCYKAVAVSDGGSVTEYVDIMAGHHADEYVAPMPVDVTFNIKIPARNGNASANVAYLAYTPSGEENWKFIALEDDGTEGDVSKNIGDIFVIEDRYDIMILKNGYIGYSGTVKIGLNTTVEVELIGGDIKGSASGTDPDGVDFGDFGDGTVDISDFVRLLRAFDSNTSEKFRRSVDINEDNVVSVTDLAVIKANYNRTDFEYKLAEGNAKVAELDILEAQRIDEIKNTPNMDLTAISGKKIYVSPNGDDSNSGLSEETPVKTLTYANTLVTSGDIVLLERGGEWRYQKIKAVTGVTYSAYGEGAKPVLNGSPENGADPDKWTLVYKNDETGALIWRYDREDWLDVGGIVFNGGEGYAYKDLPDNLGDKYYVYGTGQTELYDYREQLDRNFEFVHFADSVVGSVYIDCNNSRGELYFRCDNGNPGRVFDSLEFITRTAYISCGSNKNITVDNLCFKYSNFGVSTSTTKNITVTNSEFYWIGGCVQTYAMRNAVATRYGNAIEVYGGIDGYLIDNCYFYEIYDAAVTHQVLAADGNLKMDNIVYSNNVMDKCQYSIEYFFGGAKTEGAEYVRNGTDVLFTGNLMRRAGYGFGSTRRDGNSQRHIRSGNSRNEFYDFRIENNVLDRSVFELSQTNYDDDAYEPTYDGNVYIQGTDNRLFSHGVGSGLRPYMDEKAAKSISEILGDKNAEIYYVEKIPPYVWSYSTDVVVPVTSDDKQALS